MLWYNILSRLFDVTAGAVTKINKNLGAEPRYHKYRFLLMIPTSYR